MRRMRAAGIEAFGGEVGVLELTAPVAPAPDEVVISVYAAGAGNWDEIVRVGGWDVGGRPPLALGVEAAGVVAAVGQEVTAFAPGDEVLTHPLPLRHQGAWAELLIAPAGLVAQKPTAGLKRELESLRGGFNNSKAPSTSSREPSRCSLCGRLHRPLPGRCSAGLETVAFSESGRWLCRDTPTSEWRRCEHWAIDAVLEKRRRRLAGR
jgi:hypothetical protein